MQSTEDITEEDHDFMDIATEMSAGDDVPLVERPRNMVYAFVSERLDKTDTHVEFKPGDVYVVWFCKTLQHWKALVSTTLPDRMYYEVTYNGDKAEVYIDAYQKVENKAFSVVEWVV